MEDREKYHPYKQFHSFTAIPDWLYKVRYEETDEKGNKKTKKLSSLAKFLWGRLYRYDSIKGKCFPSEETLANDLDTDPKQIRLLISSLEKADLIEVVRHENKDHPFKINNEYHFLWNKKYNDTDLKQKDEENQQVDDIRANTGENPPCHGGKSPPNRIIKPKRLFNSNSSPSEKNKELNNSVCSANLSNYSLPEPTSLKRRIPFLAPKEDQTPHKLDSGLRPTKDVVDIISFWNSSNGLPHMTVPNSLGEPHTKSYERCCVLLRSALHGNFFSSIKKSDKDRILSKKEIITAIDRFKLSATSLDYKPVNKNNIRRTTLNNFLHNPYSSIEESYFEQFLVQEPELLRNSARPLDDPNPAYSEWLREAYEKYVLLGQKPEWNQVDLNKFIEGGKKMKTAAYRLRTKIIYVTDPTTMVFSLVKALSRMFVGHVGPGHIASDWTYNVLLPQVLTKMGQMDTTIYPDE